MSAPVFRVIGVGPASWDILIPGEGLARMLVTPATESGGRAGICLRQHGRNARGTQRLTERLQGRWSESPKAVW